MYKRQPLQYIPVLDWVNSSVTYNAQYNWDRGAITDTEYELGNTITNQRQIDWQGSLNLQSLYNKNKFLKKVNQKFSATRTTTKKKEQKEIKLERDIQLNMDSGTVVQHGMFTKKVRIKRCIRDRYVTDRTQLCRADARRVGL